MIAAIVALTLLGILAIFQLLLVAGLPLGKFAWGGRHTTLPRKLRIGSTVSIVIYAFIAAIIASKSELAPIIPDGTFLDVMSWVVFSYMVIGIIMNAISRSKPERYVMTPAAFILAVCLFFISAS